MDMQSVSHCDEVKYVRRPRDWLHEESNSGTLDLTCCRPCMPFDSYYLVQDAKEKRRALDLEGCQRTKDNWFLSDGSMSNCLLSPLQSVCCFMRQRLCFVARLGVLGYCMWRLCPL